jgi:hypothetical protein
MRNLLFIGFLLLVCSFNANSQELTRARIDSIIQAQILTGDSIPHIVLPEVAVRAKPVFKRKRDARRYWRLVYNLKKVLPYSKIIARTVIEVDAALVKIESDRERRKYIKMMEEALWDEYEDDLRKMTTTQGRLLFKLVDRETSSTTFYWIENYEGKFAAVFWQGVARLFRSNLKAEYDPEGTDKLIEELIPLIEAGYL